MSRRNFTSTILAESDEELGTDESTDSTPDNGADEADDNGADGNSDDDDSTAADESTAPDNGADDDEPTKLTADEKRAIARTAFESAVAEIEGGNEPRVAPMVEAFSPVPKGREFLDLCSAETFQGWASDPDKVANMATWAPVLTMTVDNVKALLPAKGSTAKRAVDPTVAQRTELAHIVRVQNELKEITSTLDIRAREIAGWLSLSDEEFDSFDGSSHNDLPSKVRKGLAAIESHDNYRGRSAGGRSASSPSEFTPGTDWHHVDRDGTVHTLSIGSDGAYTVDGESTDDESPSNAAKRVNGGTSVNGRTYWKSGASPSTSAS